MEFLILNRQVIDLMDIETNHIIISITEPQNEFPKINPKKYCKGILQICYTDEDDYEKAKLFNRHHYLFTPKQADLLIDYVFKCKDSIELIICQCDGGISRSSATAAALSVILNGPKSDDWIFKSKQYVPNMHVYRTLLNSHLRNL